MTKRRTRKDKQQAKHQFTVSWSPGSSEAENLNSEPSVKRQIITGSKLASKNFVKTKKASNLVKESNLASIKKDIIKSVALAGLILASEVVLYLTTKV